MDNRPKESRRCSRINFSGPLRCQVRGFPKITSTVGEDLSLSGVKFINDSFIPPNTPVMLEINLLSQVIRPIAQIVWATPLPRQDKFHLGAKFLEISLKEKETLSEFLTLNYYQK